MGKNQGWQVFAARWKKRFFSWKKTARQKPWFLPQKIYQLVSASTAQSFDDFLLIQTSAWKCVVSLVYCIAAIASSINTIDGVTV